MTSTTLAQALHAAPARHREPGKSGHDRHPDVTS